MALDVQWLSTGDAAEHCLIAALRNGYLWVGDAGSACMGAIETPLSALSCVTSWQNDSGSYAAAAGQGPRVLLYGIGCKDVSCLSQGQQVAKKKKKKARKYAGICFKPARDRLCAKLFTRQFFYCI